MAVKDRAKVIDRIRAAMAIADSPSATQQERDQATSVVSRLIAEYQIEMAELRNLQHTGPSKIVNFDVSVSNRYGLGRVRTQAVHAAVVRPLGGHSINFASDVTSAKDQVRLAVFLPEDVASMAEILISSLLLQMENTMKVASTQHRRELIDGWVSTSELNTLVYRFRVSYLMSWGKTVGARVRAGRQLAEHEVSEATGKDIVLADTSDQAKVASKSWAEDNGYTTRKSRSVMVTATGVGAGRADGLRASIGGNEIGGSRRSLS